MGTISWQSPDDRNKSIMEEKLFDCRKEVAVRSYFG
jgi:hypothetical protein